MAGGFPESGVSLVVPTLGRASAARLLAGLAAELPARAPVEVLLVRDREGGEVLPVPPELRACTRVLAGRGAGPAAARNLGWRHAGYGWVVFLDDDVLPGPGWWAALLRDLAVPEEVGGVQGRVRVPLPGYRRPTDWERTTAGLAGGWWLTADMAYRRAVLAAVDGFDERFPRAYREDAELAYRVVAAGWRLRAGGRRVVHPVRPESRWVSLRSQRGNADDALLRRLYGPQWRMLLAIPRGARSGHVVTTVAGVVALAAGALAVSGSTPLRTAAGMLATAAGAGWLARTGWFAVRRIRPGPTDPAEWWAMGLTSAAIPPLACLHWLRGWWRGRGARPWSAAMFAAAAVGNHFVCAGHAFRRGPV